MLRGGGGSGGIFLFGSCVKGTLSSPDTELIMPLQLVAEHSAPWLTRCSGPADPEGEVIAKLQQNPPTFQSRRLTAVVCAHVRLGNCCFVVKNTVFLLAITNKQLILIFHATRFFSSHSSVFVESPPAALLYNFK